MMGIQLLLILSACIVNFMLESTQQFKHTSSRLSINKIENETSTIKEIQGKSIRKDFQQLLDSIVKNNTKNSKIYQQSLKEEVAKEKQAFDALKGTLQIARVRNLQRKINFHNENYVGKNVVAAKRETTDEDPNDARQTPATGESNPVTSSLASTSSSVNIARILSLQSDIVQFVATYTKPEVIYTRRTTKYRRRLKKTKKRWQNNSTPPTTRKRRQLTKTYPVPAVRRAVIYEHLADILSQYDEQRKEELTLADRPHSIVKNICYLTVFGTFMQHCYYGYYKDGGMQEMKKLLARACVAHWLTTAKIINVLQNSCKKRFKFIRTVLE